MNFQATGDATKWIEHELLTPHYLHHGKYSYAIAWAIVGYFGTRASKEFLLDVVARVLLLFPEATRLPYEVSLRENAHILDTEPYELKEFAKRLPSLPWGHEDTKLASFVDIHIKAKQEQGLLLRSEDALFEATRWHLYRRAYAENTTSNITEDYVLVLLETENQLLTRPKSAGDVKSKARRMAQYMQKDFVIHETIGYKEWNKKKRNEYMREYRLSKKDKNMSTSKVKEHLNKVNKNRRIKTWNKIKTVLDDIFLQDEIKMKNGKYKITAIAKLAELKRQTVSEHLKAQGII